MSTEELSVIENQPNAIALRVSGLDQTTFEFLIENYGSQFTGIQFWKCPRIADFSALEDLPQLTHISIYWNQRTERLWNFKKTPKLLGLRFDDFRKLRDLSELGGAFSLEELKFGDRISAKAVFESLDPLISLNQLRTLDFNTKRIVDGRIQPLAELINLESLNFFSNQFTTRQIAWLRARLPENVKGRSLAPTISIDPPLVDEKKELDIRLVGKRMPYLNSVSDAVRVGRHENHFWRLVEEFSANLELQPD